MTSATVTRSGGGCAGCCVAVWVIACSLQIGHVVTRAASVPAGCGLAAARALLAAWRAGPRQVPVQIRRPVALTVRVLPGDDGGRGAAAVHVEHASVDERGLVAGQVDRGVRDGLGVSGT